MHIKVNSAQLELRKKLGLSLATKETLFFSVHGFKEAEIFFVQKNQNNS